MPRHAAPARPRKIRKYLISVVAVPLLLGGIAAAYFTLNTGQGSFQVSNAGFSIALSPAAGPALMPGNGATQTINFTVTNNSSQVLTLNNETATINTDSAGGIYDTLSGAWKDTCQASWFNITWGDGGVPLPAQIAIGSGLANGQIFVTMPANSAINQSSCAGLSPEISLSVS